MVSTRHSIGGRASSPAEDLSSLDPKASKALQKLKIAGKDALMGEKEKGEKKNVRVYHYRGAVYEVEEGTKAEWVENQPKRYQKKDRAHVQEDEEVEAPRPVKRARKSMPERDDGEDIRLSTRDPAARKRHSMPSRDMPKSARKTAKPASHDDNNSPIPSHHSPLPDQAAYARELAQRRDMARGSRLTLEPYSEQELLNNATASAIQRLKRNQLAVKEAMGRYQRARKFLERKRAEREGRVVSVSPEMDGLRTYVEPGMDGSVGLGTPLSGEEERERVVLESTPEIDREVREHFFDAPEYDEKEVVENGVARDDEGVGDGPARDEELGEDGLTRDQEAMEDDLARDNEAVEVESSHDKNNVDEQLEVHHHEQLEDQQRPGDHLTDVPTIETTPPTTAGAARPPQSPILDPRRHSIDPHELADEATGPNSYPVGVKYAHDRRPSLNPDYARNYRSQTAPSPSPADQSSIQRQGSVATPSRDQLAGHKRTHSQLSTSPTTASITGSTSTGSSTDYTAFSTLDPSEPLPETDKGGQPLKWSISITNAGPRDDASNVDYTAAEYVFRDVRLENESKAQKRRRMRREQTVCLGWKRNYGGKVVRETEGGGRSEWRERDEVGEDGGRLGKRIRVEGSVDVDAGGGAEVV